MAFNGLPVDGALAANGPNEGPPPQNSTFAHGRSRYFIPQPLFLPRPARGDGFACYYSGSSRLSIAAQNSQVGQNLRPPNWTKVPLSKCQERSYHEHFKTAQRPQEEVDSYREANGVTVEGRSVPKPILHIDESGFSEYLTSVIEVRNCGSSPTALQAHCWPVALSGRDVVAVDSTVSKGKPLAYLVPAILHVQNQHAVQHPPVTPRGGGPVVLVLTATREAAQHVEVVARDLSGTSRILTTCLVSGDPKEWQLEQLKQGVDMCIAMPGRLVAFMEDCKVNLQHCTYLVIDEADRMLTMGLAKLLRIICNYMRPNCQTFVVLASQTKDTHQLIEEMTKDPVTITIRGVTLEDQNLRVEHVVYVCKEAEKEDKLFALLNDVMNDESDRAIVFVERKQTVEDIASSLRLRGWSAIGIHGKKTEHEQKWSLDALHSGKAVILVSTDMAARNLGLANVRFVVSYDYPSNPAEYQRRLKNATRSDATARKYTFLEPDDYVHAREMIWFLEQTQQAVPPQLRKVANMASRK